MTRPPRMSTTLLVTLAIGVGLAGCGGGDDGDRGDASKTQNRGGTLTVMANADVDSLDPGLTYYQFGYLVQSATQRPLYSFAPEELTTPVPDLARSEPEIAPDGKSVTVQ